LGLGALSTPLLWRVVPWLFLSVVFVQLFALYPIVQSYRQTLYEYRSRTLRTRVETLARLHAVAPEDLDRTLSSCVKNPVLGIALLSDDGSVLSRHGRPSPFGERFVPQGSTFQRVQKDTLAVTWVGEVDQRTYRAVATLDTSEEARAVEDFVLRQGLFSIPAALLATVAGAFVLLVGVLAPIRRLRDELMSRASTHFDPGDRERESLDELEQLRVLVERLDEARARARRAEQRAEAASRSKDEFLANMSHELRTPLSSIISYAQILLESRTTTEAELKGDLGKIAHSARHVSDLVGSILTFSKLEAGRMLLDLDDFVVADIVRETVVMIEPVAVQNGNRVTVELPKEPVTMHSDAVKVRQSLLNVLGNACKFTSKGTVNLRVSTVVEDGDEVVKFEIEDTGIGMTAEELAIVFEPFVQGDRGTTRRYGGTGLGLSITRRFTAMLGGRVDVESTPGQGSRFTIALPRVRTAEAGVSS
jgi:signal transduction histidine kinase